MGIKTKKKKTGYYSSYDINDGNSAIPKNKIKFNKTIKTTTAANSFSPILLDISTQDLFINWIEVHCANAVPSDLNGSIDLCYYNGTLALSGNHTIVSLPIIAKSTESFNYRYEFNPPLQVTLLEEYKIYKYLLFVNLFPSDSVKTIITGYLQ